MSPQEQRGGIDIRQGIQIVRQPQKASAKKTKWLTSISEIPSLNECHKFLVICAGGHDGYSK